MSQFLDAYSIQYWLESCPQAYLEGTEFGHAPGEKEPEGLLDDPFLRERPAWRTEESGLTQHGRGGVRSTWHPAHGRERPFCPRP